MASATKSEAIVGRQIIGCLEQPGAQTRGLVVSGRDVLDVGIEVDPLRHPIGPLRWDVVTCELNTHSGLAVNVAGVPVVVRLNRAAQQPSPKGAHGVQIGRVEDEISFERSS